MFINDNFWNNSSGAQLKAFESILKEGFFNPQMTLHRRAKGSYSAEKKLS